MEPQDQKTPPSGKETLNQKLLETLRQQTENLWQEYSRIIDLPQIGQIRDLVKKDRELNLKAQEAAAQNSTNQLDRDYFELINSQAAQSFELDTPESLNYAISLFDNRRQYFIEKDSASRRRQDFDNAPKYYKMAQFCGNAITALENQLRPSV